MRGIENHNLEPMLKQRQRETARLAELQLPPLETVALYGGIVMLGATVLVHQTLDGRGEITLLDPRMGADRRMVAQLTKHLAPQPLRHRTSLSVETGHSRRPVSLSVARQSERELLGALSGDQPVRVEDHLGLLRINDEQVSPHMAMMLAKGIAVLSQKGTHGLERHLELHDPGIRLARR